VLDAVVQMDLGAFYAAYRQDGHGRAAFEPSMVVALWSVVLLAVAAPLCVRRFRKRTTE
jgi:uncharacterized membrane protein YhaH (DUF805 family)